MDGLRAIQDTISNIIGTRIGGLQKQRNSIASPMSILPVELFLKIIVLSLDEISPDSHAIRLEVLRSVCSMWAACLLASKELWAKVYIPWSSSDKAVRRVKQLLDRSGDAPLELEIKGHSAQIDEAIAPHANRWRSLTIYRPLLTRKSALSLAAPKLESLALEGSSAPEQINTELVTPLLGKHAPNLRSMYSTYLGIWEMMDPGILRNLRYMHFKYHHQINVDNEYSRMVKVISFCPALESLEITFTRASWAFDPPSIEEPIVLSSLTSLALRMQADIVAPLLRDIQTPSCRSYSYRSIGSEYNPPEIDTAIEAFFPALQTGGRVTARVMVISTGADEIFLTSGDVEIRLGGVVDPFQAINKLETISRIELIVVGNDASRASKCLSQLGRVPLDVEEIAVRYGEFRADEFLATRRRQGSRLQRLEVWDAGEWVNKLRVEPPKKRR